MQNNKSENIVPDNASRPDPQRYIANLREMDARDRRVELIGITKKLQSAINLGISPLIGYYATVQGWLIHIVNFEMNEMETERPDLFEFNPPKEGNGII